MLGRPIAARPLARDGFGLLGSEPGRTRLAEAPVPAWGRAAAMRVEDETGASAAPTGPATATRP
ncbi:MAG TPA: hypothetical protein VEC11_10160 [Allosphingosinicella sp.]|nr:hypothetical protein [Allosphingosinicella sp.]